MSKYDKIISGKHDSAQYMMDEIKHIITTIPKRAPGSEGEKLACEYMADVLEKDCGCQTPKVESFKLNPNSFYGWIYITMACAMLAIVAFFFVPIVGILLVLLGLAVAVLCLGFYTKVVDWMFPQKTGHNVSAFKKPTDEVKCRIVFNGHPDAAWNWWVNEKFGGVVHLSQYFLAIFSAIYILAICIVAVAVNGVGFNAITSDSGYLYTLGMCQIICVPFLVLLCFMWNERQVVDGANDNLTGCYMGIALIKALTDAGIELKHTELGVVLTGSEEAGLRGAKAWAKAHAGEFDDVPTFVYCFDTIYDGKFLAVNYRDLNAMVKADQEVSDLFMKSASDLGETCERGMVPPLGGATDSAAFAQGGFRATGITSMDHNLEPYYHTRKDTWDNMNKDGLAKCFAVTVKTLENFEEKYGK
ncbi:MAG: M20/M25/M40 family metallo-hydrolase [Bacillota bacterium]